MGKIDLKFFKKYYNPQFLIFGGTVLIIIGAILYLYSQPKLAELSKLVEIAKTSYIGLALVQSLRPNIISQYHFYRVINFSSVIFVIIGIITVLIGFVDKITLSK